MALTSRTNNTEGRMFQQARNFKDQNIIISINRAHISRHQRTVTHWLTISSRLTVPKQSKHTVLPFLLTAQSPPLFSRNHNHIQKDHYEWKYQQKIHNYRGEDVHGGVFSALMSHLTAKVLYWCDVTWEPISTLSSFPSFCSLVRFTAFASSKLLSVRGKKKKKRLDSVSLFFSSSPCWNCCRGTVCFFALLEGHTVTGEVSSVICCHFQGPFDGLEIFVVPLPGSQSKEHCSWGQ